MARPVITDYLQSFPFWMMDVAPIEPLALPIFNPLLGFTSISAPDLQIEDYPIHEGNWYLERRVIKRGAYGPFSVRRAVSFSDSDFWKWTMAGLTGGAVISVGGPTYRRNFLLIHFFSRNPSGGSQTLDRDSVARANALAVTDPANANDYLRQRQFDESGIGGNISYGPFEFAVRVPAKAYMLKGCIPLRWRAGTDFDAQDGSVSIAELDFACEMVEEISLAGSINGAVGAVIGPASVGLEALFAKLING